MKKLCVNLVIYKELFDCLVCSDKVNKLQGAYNCEIITATSTNTCLPE